MSEIIDYTAPEKVNPYADDVAALIAAGEGKAGKITVDADKVKNAALKYRQAANASGKTARQRDQIENGDGTVSLVYTLTDRYRKGSAKVTEGETVDTDSPTETDAPAEDAAVVEAPAHKRGK